MSFAHVNEIKAKSLLEQVALTKESFARLELLCRGYEQGMQRNSKILQELMKDRETYIRILEISERLDALRSKE